ncbi:Uncharacterized conserved protein YbjT, contains NAD(P)-binding and DUF2867 domains [Flexibacter flexilis DSM 6793]|uniref:Uncharacterized conserved protein YbjT, contains NAD(P)-binding and DUF2867 domains n=1 Tax=Flexibacter flexilis DSM 6793 TaxID=927664 RepID=A0A1I1F6F7_9BACT|nr:NAD(P)H-binding protein [Flexibacter flexilis]SFB94877.1 Uncharacterized conserved protein YbjT, contains NAD(P)-binding and DUF2867 domains [Flexibacter flexilis DSM 6793]
MKALLIGATGATGHDLLELLLQNDDYQQVDVFVRRDLGIKHDKLRTHIIDFGKPEEWAHLVTGDVLFSCLGTTLKVAGSQAQQRIVDYDYQLAFAKAAKANAVNCYVLVSSSGASSQSRIFYSKMKGELEDAVKALQFSKLLIFNPPLLERKNSDRKMEVLALKVFAFFNGLGLLGGMRPLATDLLAKAMLKAVQSLGQGQHIIKDQEIRNYTNG